MVALTFGSSILSKPGPAEIADVNRQLRVALGGLIETEIFAKALNEKYSNALK